MWQLSLTETFHSKLISDVNSNSDHFYNNCTSDVKSGTQGNVIYIHFFIPHQGGNQVLSLRDIHIWRALT